MTLNGFAFVICGFEDMNPELAHGPIENRGCTDIICFFIFVAALVAAFVIAFVGFAKGKPSLLAVPYDPNGSLFQQYIFIHKL